MSIHNDIELQNQYARHLQAGFPLHPTPFARLAAELCCSEADLLTLTRDWVAQHKLREISAILEGQALGYDSALVAGCVAPRDLERVAAIVNAHPTVTHNYERTHHYNLWFTLAVPQHMGLEATLELLARESGVSQFLPLRRTQTFKIGVSFDLVRKQSITAPRTLKAPEALAHGPRERVLLRALQQPLPIESRPFARLAERAGVSEQELLELGGALLGSVVRRYAGTFHHRNLGVHGNGMVVWDVPEAEHARVGALLASAPEVSHCYARNALPGFPYTLYSMIHGPTREAVQSVATRLSGEIGAPRYLELFSTREFKKCRLRFFLPELDSWWSAAHAGAA